MTLRSFKRTIRQITSLAFTSALLGISQNASATAWFDYAQSAPPVTIVSEDSANATVVLRRSAVCPKNGYLLATGGGSFHAYPDTTVFSYSLTTDNTAPFAMDFNHAGTIRPNFNFGTLGVYDIPFSLQRIDACKAGQNITYRLAGIVSNGFVGDSAVYSSTLIIQFFDTII